MNDIDVGGLYLLHFEPPYKHAQHYLGWADNIGERVAKHMRGAGSPLVRAAVSAGSVVTVARVWPNASRKDEAKHKRSQHNVWLCPVCSPRGRPVVSPRNRGEDLP